VTAAPDDRKDENLHRRLPLTVLLENPGHRSAEELAASLQAAPPTCTYPPSTATLDEGERLKVIDRTRLGHGPATYHLAAATPWAPGRRAVRLDDRSPGRQVRQPRHSHTRQP
ncbi:MAG: hypothetical protein ACLP5E_05820, partial [Streptosporangiaceae bacterium]